MAEAVIRCATPDDLDLICDHRARIFLEAGRPRGTVERIAEPTRAWHRQRLIDGRYSGWIAESADRPVASCGLVFLDWAPGFSHPDTDRRGLVLNLYVEPDYRGRGLARTLLRNAQESARAQGVTFLVLHATESGRPLYEHLGWSPTTEMSLRLEAA